jgi:hypothetical protein
MRILLLALALSSTPAFADDPQADTIALDFKDGARIAAEVSDAATRLSAAARARPPVGLTPVDKAAWDRQSAWLVHTAEALQTRRSALLLVRKKLQDRLGAQVTPAAVRSRFDSAARLYVEHRTELRLIAETRATALRQGGSLQVQLEAPALADPTRARYDRAAAALTTD